MSSNEKFVNYKVVDLFEYDNFKIKFVFSRLDLEMLWILIYMFRPFSERDFCL